MKGSWTNHCRLLNRNYSLRHLFHLIPSAEKEVYYLNVAECMKDENGMLPDEASPADGMHFGPDYYSKWFEYLKRHTVA